MMRRTWLVFSQTVTVAVAVLFVLLTFKPSWLPGSGTGSVGMPAPTLLLAAPAAAVAASASGGSSGYALAARLAAPAVVSVTATRLARNPHADDPRFRFFFGDRPQGQAQVGLGSGVIVSPEG